MTSASNSISLNAHSRDFTWRVRENYIFSNFHVAKKKTRVKKRRQSRDLRLIILSLKLYISHLAIYFPCTVRADR